MIYVSTKERPEDDRSGASTGPWGKVEIVSFTSLTEDETFPGRNRPCSRRALQALCLARVAVDPKSQGGPFLVHSEDHPYCVEPYNPADP